MNVKKLVVLIGIVVLMGCLGIFLWVEKNEQQKETAKYEELDNKIRPLNVKKNRLTLELEKLQGDYEARRKPKATAQVIFTSLDPQVYSLCYPIMREREFAGVLCLSETQLPGAEGCMTTEQFKKLQEAGWTTCVTWKEGAELSKWWPTFKQKLQQMELEIPQAIYCPKGTYKSNLDEKIKQAGFSIVVHHEEAGRALIQTQYEEELWHLGAIGLMGGKTKTKFDEAIAAQGNIIYLVGFELEEELYEERSFTVMLDFFKSYEGSRALVVGSMQDAKDHYYSRLQEVSAEEERVFLEQKVALEQELANVQAQLDELQSK